MSLYPFKFVPKLLEKMWGGRKLESLLGKNLPPGKQIGESWELYDFPPGVIDNTGQWVSAEIANGPTFAHAVTKRMLHAEWAMPIDVAIAAEAQAQARCMQTEDFRRAYRAFVAKSKPQFEGN